MGDFSDRIEHAFGNRDRLLEENAKLRDALKAAEEALEYADKQFPYESFGVSACLDIREALEKIRSAMK